jgi:hypothetical protein
MADSGSIGTVAGILTAPPGAVEARSLHVFMSPNVDFEFASRQLRHSARQPSISPAISLIQGLV